MPHNPSGLIRNVKCQGLTPSTPTRAGQLCTYSYDNRNRQTQASWAGNAAPTVTREYDDAGRLWKLNNGVSSLTYAYDEANRLTSETQQIASDSGPKVVSYGYAPNGQSDGNRRLLTYPDGTALNYAYTGRNQLQGITNASSATLVSYTYDLGGNRFSKTLGNGTSAAYGYDDAGRLLTLNHQQSTINVASFSYAYNTVNNRTSRTETVGGTAKVDAYEYDAVDQVTQVKYNFNVGANTQDRLVGYGYDAAGNRTGASGVSDSVNGNSNYAANALNQYTAAGSLVPVYDANGNMTGQDGWTYAYDAQNRMTSATSAQTSVTLAYDGRNRCVSRVLSSAEGSTTTFFYYDGWNLIEERGASDTVLARYVNGANVDEIIARVAGGVTSYHHHDALGSTVALTDATGNVIERYKYDVFGAPTILSPSGLSLQVSGFGNRFLFTGREWIQQAAVYDYRNRIYSPTFGRFLQTDPIRFNAGDDNLYRYVSNRAVDLSDPFGLQSVDELGHQGSYEALIASQAHGREHGLMQAAEIEFCGLICEKCENGKPVRWNSPMKPGGVRTCSPPPESWCGGGGKKVGIYHSHPDGGTMEIDKEKADKVHKVPIYAGHQPQGHPYTTDKYDPGTKQFGPAQTGTPKY